MSVSKIVIERVDRRTCRLMLRMIVLRLGSFTMLHARESSKDRPV